MDGHCCGGFPVIIQRKNTAYVDDSLNWGQFCESCWVEVNEHYEDLWREYYQGRL